MRLELDTEAPTPIFRQLADQLRLKIVQGELKPGDPLPSVRHVAELVRVNLNTVAKAYRILEEEGLVALEQGRGGRVLASSALHCSTVPAQAERELCAWVAKMRARGIAAPALQTAFTRALDLSGGE
ncbi:MAG: GntR family transcriptional regulator [Deltaproteobacteria bacterium]|nr:GntR family transcriptional regulator [Deltaproteobacteria bacterium]